VRLKGVLFDIGNVIVRFEPRALYSKIFPDLAACDRFLSQVCTPAWHLEHDRGAPMAETIPALIARFPEHAEAIRAWRDRAAEMLPELIEPTIEAIEALAARDVPLWAITNMPAEWVAPIIARSPAFAHFRDIVVSAHHRAVKPDPELFHIACARAGLEPSELLLIDDSPANVATALGLGFDVHLFADPAALRPALVERGLI
jgi:2-haloacid dehalogenase/putative hydrolase of the HAD superfamily